MQSVQVPGAVTLPIVSEATDDALVARVLEGETEWFAVLMRRYNGRLFRVARSITRDDHEAEDALQQAYIAAYGDLRRFRGDARLSTWLTTIVVREAMRRRRERQRRDSVLERHARDSATATTDTPEDRYVRREVRSTLEAAVDQLPEHYRTVFVLRDVQELSGAETATALDISEETVRVRLHRARATIRKRLLGQFESALSTIFEFGGERCDRMVSRVWEHIRRRIN